MKLSNVSLAVIGLVIAFGASVVGARLAFEATGEPASQARRAAWAQDRMEFVAWNGQRWTAWIRDGRFELVPEREGTWHRHSNTSIAYIDWEGEQWQARIDGEHFRIAHRGEWAGHVETVNAIRYSNWAGDPELRTVAQLTR